MPPAATVLRVWAATVDFSGDVSVGEAAVVTAGRVGAGERNQGPSENAGNAAKEVGVKRAAESA